jgi:signal transduction histidine kinase
MLIDQLLKIQQLEHGQLLLHKKFLDAGVFTREFAAKWPRPLRLETADGLRVEADPLLLEMSLANLVTNAEKYGRGSVPEIRVARAGDHARFTVRDGGRPLQRQYLKKVFRKFYRVPNLTTRRQSGVGLGLYIVRSVARLHKGEAEAHALTEPGGEGNEFSFRIPLAPHPKNT